MIACSTTCFTCAIGCKTNPDIGTEIPLLCLIDFAMWFTDIGSDLNYMEQMASTFEWIFNSME